MFYLAGCVPIIISIPSAIRLCISHLSMAIATIMPPVNNRLVLWKTIKPDTGIMYKKPVKSIWPTLCFAGKNILNVLTKGKTKGATLKTPNSF